MTGSDGNKPIILVNDASTDQLRKLQQWLEDDYTISTGSHRSARVQISYTSDMAGESGIPLVTFSKVSVDGLPDAGRSYALPENHISHAALKIILGLIAHSGQIDIFDRNYRSAFDRAHDIIILADCGHNIIKANNAALRILGYTEAELHKMNLAHLFYSKEAGEEFIKDICVENKIIHWEYRLKNKEGKPVDVLMSANMMDKEENIFLCIAQNITAHKEEQKARQQDEHLVLMGKMSQMIAHEVRNPLNNILLALSQLKADPRPVPDEEMLFLDIIDRNCHRINTLITEMLEPGRIMELELKPGSLNALLQEALAMAEDRITLRHIEVHKQMEEDCLVPMDRGKLLICISNILVNAIEAMEHTEGIISLTTGKELKHAFFTIADNGKGMTENEKNNIFNPYFSTKPRGTGMGMAATQQIIRAHQGFIHVESTKGTGSRITVFLPLQV